MTEHAVSSPSARARKRRPPLGRDWPWAVLFLLPLLIGLGVFYIGPMFVTLFYSFTKIGVFGGAKWIGFGNYIKVLTLPEVRQAMLNTLVYALIVLASVPVSIVIAALMTVKGLRFVWLFRLFFFLPVVTLPVATSWLWKLLLNGDFGIINGALRTMGIEGATWLADPRTALFAVSIVGIWSTIGYPVVIFTAAFKAMPADLHEAAELDGAGPIRRFLSITLPVISPTIFFVTVLTIIGALQMFDLVYLMIGATSPASRSAETIVYLFYRSAFIDNDKGLASALVFCLMLVVMALTFIQFRLQRRWVHYV